MKSIRKKRNALVAAFILCFLLTMSLCVMKLREAGAVVGAFTVILLYLLSKQQCRFHEVELICDNPILIVPPAIITSGGRAQETIISTFGLMIENQVWGWGSNGAYGIQLASVTIDRMHICLTFGNGIKTMQVQLLHGLSEQEEVCAVSKQLFHETGVTAEIIDW